MPRSRGAQGRLPYRGPAPPGRVLFYAIRRSGRPDQWLHPVRLAHQHTHREGGGGPPPLIRTSATCAMGWMGSGAGTSVKSLLPPCTDHGIPCQEVCFSIIRALTTAFLHFPQGIHRFAREIREFHIFPQNSRDFHSFSGIFTIHYFCPKPYPRGSGARKQPQQRLSNVGLLRIGWGSAVLDRLAASQIRRILGQATPTHTWEGGGPPHPSNQNLRNLRNEHTRLMGRLDRWGRGARRGCSDRSERPERLIA